jgi:hypothetical protein
MAHFDCLGLKVELNFLLRMPVLADPVNRGGARDAVLRVHTISRSRLLRLSAATATRNLTRIKATGLLVAASQKSRTAVFIAFDEPRCA